MCVPVKDSGCGKEILPIRDTLDIVSGKWKLLIVFHLTHGPRRFKELQRMIEGITPRMLSKELKDLEVNELVKREVFDTSPITVSYTLTEHGESLSSSRCVASVGCEAPRTHSAYGRSSGVTDVVACYEESKRGPCS
jgi:Predicted transcriptional regulators